jgi:hypothetical protein
MQKDKNVSTAKNIDAFLKKRPMCAIKQNSTGGIFFMRQHAILNKFINKSTQAQIRTIQPNIAIWFFMEISPKINLKIQKGIPMVRERKAEV